MLGRRIVVAAPYRGDVAEAEGLAIDVQQGIGQRTHITQLPARAHKDAIVGSGQYAGRCHRVLLVDSLRDLLRADAEFGQLHIGNVDVDVLVLVAEIIDFADARDVQKFGAQLIGVVMQLRGRVAIALQCIDVGIDVAELVVEERPLHARRQLRADIADFLAHLVPGLRHNGCRCRILDVEKDQRFARTRIAAQEVDRRRFLQLARNAVGHFFLHLLRARAGPEGLNHHHLEGERRVFRLRQMAVRQHAEQRDHAHQEKHQ